MCKNHLIRYLVCCHLEEVFFPFNHELLAFIYCKFIYQIKVALSNEEFDSILLIVSIKGYLDYTLVIIESTYTTSFCS
jgi:hypothetical protein